jgi:histidyl-tRNA synthetase
VFEHTELFPGVSGETTDVVEKEQYTFPDRADGALLFAPRPTAAMVRFFLEHGMPPGGAARQSCGAPVPCFATSVSAERAFNVLFLAA